MRCVARARSNPFERLFVRSSRVAQRYTVPIGRKIVNEIDHAIDLRRDRDDADVGTGFGDFVEDLLAGERALDATASRHSEALDRLGTAIIRVDEVALEVSGEHARSVNRRGARRTDVG